ncbi:MAG TPA: hypothetical protein VHN18_02320 [Micromonosporaceae bacterium]|nr:hypothetical protein [Micromonosporaceae bacterium]
MKPRVLVVAFVTAGLLVVGPAGCGIPDQTAVRVDGGGQAPGAGPAGVTGYAAPTRTESGDDVKQFAIDFLKAAAGEVSTADDRVRGFLSPTDRARLPDSKNAPVNVVRLVEGEPNVTPSEGTSTVSIAVQQVGVLRPNGVLQPPVLPESSYTFRVGNLENGDLDKREEAAGLYVYDPPPVLLMSAEALNEYYEQQAIYFWSREENPHLVPDLRYLPESVPSGRRPTEVLGWLTDGPADWLRGSVDELPQGTKTIGNAPASDGRLVVNLAAPPLPELQLKRLSTQLAWSLDRTFRQGRLELMIRDKRVLVFDVEEQRRQNLVYPESQVTSYCVLGGAIHRVATQGDLPIEPLPIAAGRNRDIQSAALARYRGDVLAALVTKTGRLVVGSGSPTATDFASSSELVGPQARPVWLRGFDTDTAVGLVVVNGLLHRFDLDAQLVPLRLPGASGTVTAVSAALDGRRIAVIAGERLFVASMNATTREVAQVRPVPVSLSRPTAVAWTAENDLVVAGQNRNGRTALIDVTVDGGEEDPRLDDLGLAKVDHLAAYPYNPVRGEQRVMYEANRAVWSAATPSPYRIRVDQLEGVEDPPPRDARPTAPFFLF